MADRDEKIFPALPQKRQRAREQGHLARSQRSQSAGLVYVAAIVFLTGATSMVSAHLLGAFREALAVTGSPDLAVAMGRALMWPLLTAFVLSAVVLASAAIVGASAQDGVVNSLSRSSLPTSRASTQSATSDASSRRPGRSSCSSPRSKSWSSSWSRGRPRAGASTMAAEKAHDLTEGLYCTGRPPAAGFFMSAR